MLPSGELGEELLPPRRREAVVLGSTVVADDTPERRDPAAILQLVKAGIEGAVLDLQHVLRSSLDGVRDRVTMRRPDHEDPEDQHVERLPHSTR